MMRWEGLAVVTHARLFGEADAIVSVFSEEQGLRRAVARGGWARGKRGTWQTGNLVQARWRGRLEEGLGRLDAETVQPTASLAMADATALAVVAAGCAVMEAALPVGVAHPATFAGAMRWLAGEPPLRFSAVEYVRWEAALLAELGYGLDLSACAVGGGNDDLRWVSPRTGRAVADSAAEGWRDRLLPLPGFLLRPVEAGWGEVAAGLRLTGHFLARDAVAHAWGLPAARSRLVDRVERLEVESLPERSRP